MVDDLPPWFEVEFMDAGGRARRVIDKEPIFGYPEGDGQTDEVHVYCTVLETVGEVSTIRLDWHVATADEVSTFEVATASLRD